jgi:glutathione S-transferase/alkylated DNA repair dioxygenase AlkB
MDALDLGFLNVTLVTDCIGETASSAQYLPDLCRRGTAISSLAALTGVVLAPGGGRLEDSFYCSDVVPEDLSARAFDAILAQVEWQPMTNRGGPVPRKIAVEGAVEQDGTLPLYRHPADKLPHPRPFSPTVDAIRRHAEQRLGGAQRFNHVLIQLYRDGADSISAHADKTLDIARGTAIVNVSFGGRRTMVLSPKPPPRPASAGGGGGGGADPAGAGAGAGAAGATSEFAFAHNSMFVLGPDTNRRLLHSIPPDRRPAAQRLPEEARPRVSLTFRTVATFLTPDGRLFGQGAVAKRRAGARPVARAAAGMLRAFARENGDAGFAWDAHYGPGFDCVDVLEDMEAPSPDADAAAGEGGEGRVGGGGGERTLYWVNGSVPSWRVLLALHEKRLPFRAVRLHVRGPRPDTRAPAFLAVSPSGEAPALVEADGAAVVGSLAILAHLEAAHPRPRPLLPPPGAAGAAGAAVMGLAQESDRLLDAYEGMEGVFELRAAGPAAAGAGPDPARRARLARAARAAREATRAELGRWEARAGRAEYIASGEMSLADCAFYPVLAYLVHRGLELDGLPRLAAYWARVRARDSAARSHPLRWAFDGPAAGFSVFRACAEL